MIENSVVISHVKNEFSSDSRKKASQEDSKNFHINSKLELFQTIKKNLAILCFKRNQTDSYFFMMRQHWSCFLKSALSLTSLFLYLFYVAKTGIEFMYSMFLSTASLFIFVAFTSTVFKTSALYNCFDHAESILKKKLIEPKWMKTFERVNPIVEKWCEIAYCAMVRVSLPCFVSSRAIVSFYQYLTTDLGNEAFELSLPMWLPFNWKNPIGYLIAMAFECTLLLNPLRYMAVMMTLGFAIYMHGTQFVKNAIDDMHLFNELAKSEGSKGQKQQQCIFELISKCVCVHSDAKEMIREFSYLYETILLAVIVGSTCAIAMCMLMIQVEISKDEFDWNVLLELIVCGMWSIIMVFVACEICERGGEIFGELEDILNQFDWYCFPLKIQKMLPTVLIIIQKPVTVKCFGSSIACTRQCFKQVVNKGYSSFMVLHKLYN